MDKTPLLSQLTRRIRHNIIESTTAAESGHPSSSLSAVELTSVLFFDGFFHQDSTDFSYPFNDKFILSKGHAAPLLYSLYEAAGVIEKKELLTLRKFGSRLQGHPTPLVPFVDVATGSLGQGLSVGLGMALGLRLKVNELLIERSAFRVPRVFVLLGDSEMAEGQVWEAMEIASYYHVNNLVGIVDINRLGQSGETDLGWDVETYKKRIATFGWRVIEIKNGHNLKEIHEAFTKATEPTSIHTQKPVMILAHTVKGKGVPFMEDKMGWHGKPVPQDRLQEALKAIGSYDKKVKGIIAMPPVVDFKIQKETKKILDRLSASIDSTNTVVGGTGERVPDSTELRPSRRSTGGNESRGRIYDASALVATREAFGDALADLGSSDNRVVALDAEVGNSTYTERLKKTNPSHFLEMFIDEENMISVALGISKIGYVPYLSTFAAFLTRAFDQIRMAQYSLLSPISNLQSPISLNIIGSHAGCSIGADGVSQMGLEDIAMMRSIRESTVLYPADAVSAYKLTQAMATRTGINYLRTTREKTPIIYGPREEFPIGGCKLHYAPDLHSPITNHQSPITNYDAVIIAAGITLHEALKAQKILEKQGKHTIVVDLYSVKPLDSVSIIRIIETAKQVIVVEDHYAAGGIGEAVLSALSYFRFRISDLRFTHLCVRKEPRSGTTEELLRYEGIDAEAIMQSLLVKLTFAA